MQALEVLVTSKAVDVAVVEVEVEVAANQEGTTDERMVVQGANAKVASNAVGVQVKVTKVALEDETNSLCFIFTFFSFSFSLA